jgi:choline dehydrogenase-like flavoprotein
MIYCRGSASVFDEWAEISGNAGLAWDSILSDFQATTTWEDQRSITYKQAINTSSFGNGPLAVSRQRKLFPLDIPIFDEFKSTFGVPEIDFASGDGIGVSLGINTIRSGNRTRSYAYDSFGYIAETRSNFKLIANALVSNIGFSGTKAEMVTYNNTLTNTLTTICAKEIIVAAGAIRGPQLLMLSGVGPADRLTELGIPVVLDVPEIGLNLVDHHNAVLQFSVTTDEITDWQYDYNSTVTAQANAEYADNGNGVLGMQWGDVISAIRLPDEAFEGVDATWYKNLPADRPHVAFEYINTGNIIPGVANVSSMSAWVSLIQPEGLGNLTLGSANYLDAPIIYGNYYGSPADKAAALYGYKQLRSILSSDSLKPLLPLEVYPGTNVTSDADIWAAMQKTARSWHHPVGTVALGTVLDSNWRVKGLQGLRVVGSPAIPYISTCPIQATVYAVGHRAALDIEAADRF